MTQRSPTAEDLMHAPLPHPWRTQSDLEDVFDRATRAVRRIDAHLAQWDERVLTPGGGRLSVAAPAVARPLVLRGKLLDLIAELEPQISEPPAARQN